MYRQWAADRMIDRQAELAEVPQVEADPLIRRLDLFLTVGAFRRLSGRWRAVLWYLEVENMSMVQAAGMLGMQPNAVAALAFRAREALRIAYLQMHVNTEVADGCREAAEHLVAWLCGRLHRGLRFRVAQHVNDCGQCAGAAGELSDLVAELRRMVPPMAS